MEHWSKGSIFTSTDSRYVYLLFLLLVNIGAKELCLSLQFTDYLYSRELQKCKLQVTEQTGSTGSWVLVMGNCGGGEVWEEELKGPGQTSILASNSNNS